MQLRQRTVLAVLLCLGLLGGISASAFAQDGTGSQAASAQDVQNAEQAATSSLTDDSQNSSAETAESEQSGTDGEEVPGAEETTAPTEDATESEAIDNSEASEDELGALSETEEEPAVTVSDTGALQVDTELELRETVENSTGSITIELMTDITMTDPYPNHPGGNPAPYAAMYMSQYASLREALYIAPGKDITLIGNHKLIGTENSGRTIIANGNLTLDGPTITHAAGTTNTRGIEVGLLHSTYQLGTHPRAQLHFKSGAVTGNSGIGVTVAHGNILMTGGEIYGNGTREASSVGGGLLIGGNGTNVAENLQYGGSVTIQGGSIHDNAAVNGGGIYLGGNTLVSLKVTGGAIYNNTATDYGGGICGARYFPVNIEISGGSIYGNSAYRGGGVFAGNGLNMSGGTIYGNTADYGGGISTDEDVTLSGGEIYENSAMYGGGIYSYTYYNEITLAVSGTAKIRDNVAFLEGASSYGGGIYAPNNAGSFKLTRIELSGGEISGNEATYGGGAYVGTSNEVTLSDGTVYGNEAAYGGGIYANTCTATISGGEIRGNTAAGSGGGVFINGGTLAMSAGAFDANTATYGGGIFNSGGTLNITGGSISNNSATNPHDSEYSSGGGIYTEDYSQLTVGANVVFSGNTANKLTKLLEEDAAFSTYEENIAVPNGQWSVQGVQYGYNNYDINYLGEELELLTVSFVAGTGGSLSGTTEYTGILQGTPFEQAVIVPTPQAADGYVFNGWSPALPSNGQEVTESVTYTAIFVEQSVTPPSVVPPTPGTTTPTTPTTPAVTPPTVVNTTNVIEVLQDEGVPTIEAGDTNVPLTAGAYTDMVWALLNLVMAVVGIVLALITVVYVSTRRNQRSRDEYDSRSTNGAGLVGAVVAILAAIVGAVVFFFTEDVTLPMVLIDNWTLLMAIILVVGIVGMIVGFRFAEQDREDTTQTSSYVLN